MKTTVTWNNAGPHTIWARLAARLGREPTNAEAAAEVRRILSDVYAYVRGTDKQD